jgi:ATP-dependent RNA helicase DeaD
VAEASVWFWAAIGRKKNAEARWLLPMICRRGGIDKHDIGAIRILDTTTEFEISERVAASFATSIRQPDKEDNIRIEPLAVPPDPALPGQAPSEKRPDSLRREAGDTDHGARRSDNSCNVTGPMQPGKPRGGSGSKFDRESGSGHKKKHRNNSGRAGQPRWVKASPAKAALGKKVRKNRRGRLCDPSVQHHRPTAMAKG